MADFVLKQIPVEMSEEVANLAARKRSQKSRKIGRAVWRWMLSLCDWNEATMKQAPGLDNSKGVGASVSAHLVAGPQ